MLQSAFNNLDSCGNKVNETLIRLGDQVAANSKFGLNRKIDIFSFLVAAKISEHRRLLHIIDEDKATEELAVVKRSIHQEVIVVNDKWDKSEW